MSQALHVTTFCFRALLRRTTCDMNKELTGRSSVGARILMTLPTALVKVTLVEVDGLDLGALVLARAPFLVAHVGSRGLGRYSLVPTPATQLVALHTTSQPWECEFGVSSDAAIPVGLFLWDDLGDLAPLALGAVDTSIPAGYGTQDYVLPSSSATPRARFRVQVTPVPASSRVVSVARGTRAQPTPNVVAVNPTAVIDITQVLGLYKPGAPRPAGLTRSARQAEYEEGYTSEDNRGRIYLERNLSGRWTHDTQLIQVTADVRLSGATLPSDAKVKWTLLDPDDPSNEAVLEAAVPGGPATDSRPPNVHEEWGPELDENDYAAAPFAAGSPRSLQASRVGDNSGPARTPRFQQVPGYALTPGAVSPPEAETAIVAGISKVKVHCSGHAGDNLIVRAELTTTTPMTKIPATAGIMTLWQLINVEYRKMQDADPLPVADVPQHFVPSFVQMEFTSPLSVPNLPDFGGGDPAFRQPLQRFIENHFQHRNQGGWFFLLAARLPYQSTGGTAGLSSASTPGLTGTVGALLAPTPSLSGGDAPIVDFIDAAGDRRGTGSVTLQLSGGRMLNFNTQTIQYDAVADSSRIWLSPHDIHDRFDAGDGSLANAHRYEVNHYLSGRLDSANVWTAGGYGVTGAVTFNALVRGHYPAGTSPNVRRGGVDFFAGRTVVFTQVYHGSAAPNDAMCRAIVHELTHAFGMPHKCGWWDYQTPRQTTCCMNYAIHGMVDRATANLVATTPRPGGMNHCGKHIREIRRTVLSRNRGLGWA